MRSTIEIFLHGEWVPAAEFDPAGKPHAATFEYLPAYVFYTDSPVPLSLTMPVNGRRLGYDLQTGDAPACPAFLLDLVPQGRGRKYLLKQLGQTDQEAASDLLLAQYGAFNPVGNLRLDTAVAFYERCKKDQPDTPAGGFSTTQILNRQEDVLEHIWMHSMLAAGTTGVQGAAPKFMLTKDHDGLWHADAALADNHAAEHWLVKLARGKEVNDALVLASESSYLRVATHCGLRTQGEPSLCGNLLFVPRFDRLVDKTGVQRLHQETLASLAGIHDFGLTTSQFDLVKAFQSHVSDPAEEIAEFIRRDVLNMAMGNPDNHARNTSVQRLPDGTVQLTPLYDFAPMYLDSDYLVRGCRWRLGSGAELTDWNAVLDTLDLDSANIAHIAESLYQFAFVVEDLPAIMRDCGVAERVINDCLPKVAEHADRLGQIRPSRGYGQTP
jgi:serine/threonine-protein kinase HipA